MGSVFPKTFLLRAERTGGKHHFRDEQAPRGREKKKLDVRTCSWEGEVGGGRACVKLPMEDPWPSTFELLTSQLFGSFTSSEMLS